ncbi:MAG: histidinol-phosphatase [Chloroflexota bacterium]|jgi:histidinol-phosphatase (PHP family)|nr:histidinol-phosphatase [Chloroflexota bacterium]
MLDYHVHTTQSADCNTPMRLSCEAAIRAGVTEIAFTDHIEHEPADMGFGFYRYEQYLDDLERARGEFGDRLVILAGAEVDYNRGIQDDVERFLSNHEFDFVIGSVHYGDAGEIIFPEYFDGRSLDDVFLAYFEEVHAAVETGWFDTIGHIDLPKRYAPLAVGEYVPSRYRDSLMAIFRSLINDGMSFEINTSGLRQAPRTSMPSAQIVALYASLGGKLVTIGSDSHVPETIGAGFERTYDMLELCGVHSVSRFRRRRRDQVPVSELRRPPRQTSEKG